MSGNKLLVDLSELEYDFSGESISNSIIQEVSEDIPSVSYLNFTFGSELLIPSSIFSSRLAPLQALVKFLKEEKKLSNAQISSAIKRDIRTIWLTYSAVAKKRLTFKKSDSAAVPLGIFSDEKLSILEAFVSYWCAKGMTYSEIARMVSKDPRTIWTVRRRAVRKMEEKNDTTQ